MDSRWFIEDRELPKNEQAEAKKESEKALRNSSFFRRRLERILQHDLEESYRKEENFDDPNWERIHVSEISRRKTLREVLKLIDFKEADRGR